jgi:hypothetical protein
MAPMLTRRTSADFNSAIGGTSSAISFRLCKEFWTGSETA